MSSLFLAIVRTNELDEPKNNLSSALAILCNKERHTRGAKWI